MLTSRKALLSMGVALVLSTLGCVSDPSPAASQAEAPMNLTEYAASGQYKKPMPWKAGQYVEVENLTKGKKESVSKTLLVGKEKNGWIVESVTVDKKGKKSVSQTLFLGMEEAINSGKAGGVTIGWMKMRNEDGTVQTVEGDQLAFYNLFAKSTLDSMVVDILTFTDGGIVAVPAGVFAGTNQVNGTVKIMGMKIETESWYHPSVPVNGMVKSRSKDGKTESRLVSFGFDGKSEM